MDKRLVDILEYVLIIIVVIVIRTFIVTPALVNGASMEPTLYDNEVLILNKLKHNIKDLKRFDIVVFKYNGENLIKRVIGLPGEKIEYINNKLYVNGEKIDFEFKFEDTNDFEYVVDENCIYVLGDNRDDSKDSRYFGEVKQKNIIGTILIRLFPFKKIGKIEFE